MTEHPDFCLFGGNRDFFCTLNVKKRPDSEKKKGFVRIFI